MARGSETRKPGVKAVRQIVLRCMFCQRKAMVKDCYSDTRIYPPGMSTFGIEHKCERCKLVTRF